MGIDLVMQRAELGFLRKRLLVDSLSDQSINGIHQLGEMMRQLSHLSASADGDPCITLTLAHLLHRFG
ncbi:hypothetical protein D3C80_1886330 [compost metagenome]